MPEPLHPPFSAGAQAIPRQLNRWLDVNPQGGQLTRTQSYITFPAFTQAVTWLGYSEIVCSFNFEGPNNFSLKSFSGLPIIPNYALAISYIDNANEMHRYWIWTGVGEVVYFVQTPYTGQPIGKNFRFEVWSASSTLAVQTTALQFYTSVRGNYDYRFQQDYTLVENDGKQTGFGCPSPVAFTLTGKSSVWSAYYTTVPATDTIRMIDVGNLGNNVTTDGWLVGSVKSLLLPKTPTGGTEGGGD